ncbi:MAG: A/G-specific adenine glycosylase [Chloroflexaceae bacterium]|nr:A/G-specific adenine glycosylase [Chloroflexaceae bacterium]
MPTRTSHNFRPDDASLKGLQERLLAWFRETARDLPWRHTHDPYRILVAEVMLQQTQVERVIPFYTAFLDAFPTLESLAVASTADVIRQWAGLGYNRRAVNIQRAARTVCGPYGGRFPQTVADLQKLPGIGPYTAGALASFAFGQDAACIDANIRRVLRRCLVGPEPDSSVVRERVLLDLAQSLVPPGHGGVWNQAMMELGALVCVAGTPVCQRCPLRDHCRTFAMATAQAPSSGASAASTTASATTFALRRPARRVAEPRAPFYGSNRYYRGRVVDRLRTLPPDATIPFDQLGPQVKETYTPDEQDWLRDLVGGLVRDGLVEIVGDAVRLPPGS